ncbi:2661_t:CDS:2, partial [Ambispora leptoticha]
MLCYTFYECLRELNSSDSQDSEQLPIKRNEYVSRITLTLKQIEVFVSELPGVNQTESQQLEALADLEKEMQKANKEYLEAIEEAENLMKQVKQAIQAIFADQ